MNQTSRLNVVTRFFAPRWHDKKCPIVRGWNFGNLTAENTRIHDQFGGGADMGGLIKTKGTKKLAAHFNDEFDTYMPFWRAQQALAPNALFNTSPALGPRDVDLKVITLSISDAAAGHSHRGPTDYLVLLPDIHNHPVHAHLEQRWLWFLDLITSETAL
jgi:hypothetical protein